MDGNLSSLQAICRNYFVYCCYGYRLVMHIGKVSILLAKQGQIIPNIEYKYGLKLIYSIAQCSMITNTAYF